MYAPMHVECNDGHPPGSGCDDATVHCKPSPAGCTACRHAGSALRTLAVRGTRVITHDHLATGSLMHGLQRRAARDGFRALAVVIAVATSACTGAEYDAQLEQEITVCHATVVEGIDVSEFQDTVDWNAVHGSGRQYAIARVSYGSSHLDPTFAANWRGIHAAGMIRGVYQYFRPGDDPVAQADIVVRAVGRLGPGDLPPVADVEEAGSGIVAKLQTWAARVRAGTGMSPIIYTGPYFWQTNTGSSTAFARDALWLADYTSGCPIVFGWTDWRIWQYSDGTCTGCPVRCSIVPGIHNPGANGCPSGSSVDRDRFAGTLAQLRAFAGELPDGGVPSDAAVPDAAAADARDAHDDVPDDASADGSDASADDAGETPPDGSSGDVGAERALDGGSGAMPPGCGCAAPGHARPRATNALLVALALGAARGYRRRRSRAAAR